MSVLPRLLAAERQVIRRLTIESKTRKSRSIPAGAAKVFDAPLLEDAPAGPRQSGEPFWEVAADEEAIYVKVSLKEPVRYPLLIIPRGKMLWQLFTDEAGSEINPLPYPLDGLILYFLTSLTRRHHDPRIRGDL